MAIGRSAGRSTPAGTDIYWSRWVQIWQIYPPVLTSSGQDEFKFGRSTPRSAGRSIPLVLTFSGQDEFKFGRSIPLILTSSGQGWQLADLLADLPPLVLTSTGQDEFKFGRSTPRSASRSTPQYWHLVVKMSSNLADLPLDLPADLPPWYWHQSGQDEFKFGRSTPRSAGRSIPLVLTFSGQDEFKFGRSTPLILTSSGQGWQLADLLADLPSLVLTSTGQDEFKFGRSTPRSASRSTPQYWHLVVKMSSNLADLPPWYWHQVVKMSSNLADPPLDLLADLFPWYWHLLVKMTSNLADLPLDLPADLPPWYWHQVVKMSSNLADLPIDLPAALPLNTDIKWSRMAIGRSAARSTPQYWHQVVKMSSTLANLPLPVLIPSGQEWQFHIATDI